MLSALSKLPGGAKPLVAVLAILAPIAMVAPFLFNIDAKTKVFFLVASALIAVVAGLVVLFFNRRKKQQSENFAQDIQENAGHNPNVRDKNELARLDHLKREFQRGIDIYEKKGKSLYSLPWYVIVGEPGSGKTEAIRNSDIPFPPQLQNQQQGTGGTLSMHWWFSNHAVVLDTAGRLFLDEGSSDGGKNEWTSFLQMLRRNLPECPINGLVLVIPSTELVPEATESAEREALAALRAKAARIARQFETIQEQLAVRYPVYVIVTKTDKITGFRELFESLNDQQRYQMFGWSNPNSLDDEFQPGWIRNALLNVAAKLGKRRLTLLRNPTPNSDDGHRIDEVSGLYTMPESFLELGNKLETYLRDIFAGGTWSGKPPFLRGIYFTSAMQEGAVLDKNLAEALGKLVGDLEKESQVDNTFKIDQAFFIRDLFLEKMFKERGLVTPFGKVSDVKGRIRNWIMGGIAVTALIIASFLIFSKSRPEDEIQHWKDLRHSFYNENNSKFAELIEPDPDPKRAGKYRYIGGRKNQNDSDFVGESLVTTIKKLGEKTRGRAEVSRLFIPIQIFSSAEEKRTIAFDDKVIREGTLGTLLAAARKKLIADTSSNTPQKEGQSKAHLEAAVVALAQLEVAFADGRNQEPDKAPIEEADEGDESGSESKRISPKHLVKTLLTYVLDDEGVPPDSDIDTIAATIDSVYENWPKNNPDRNSFSVSNPEKLATALRNLQSTSTESSQAHKDIIKNLSAAVTRFQNAYSALVKTAALPLNPANFSKAQEQLAALKAATSGEDATTGEDAPPLNDESYKNLLAELDGGSAGQPDPQGNTIVAAAHQELEKLNRKTYATHFEKIFEASAQPAPTGDSALAELLEQTVSLEGEPVPLIAKTNFAESGEPKRAFQHIIDILERCTAPPTPSLADDLVGGVKDAIIKSNSIKALKNSETVDPNLRRTAIFLHKNSVHQLANHFTSNLLRFPLVADETRRYQPQQLNPVLDLLELISKDIDAAPHLSEVAGVAWSLFERPGGASTWHPRNNLRLQWIIESQGQLVFDQFDIKDPQNTNRPFSDSYDSVKNNGYTSEQHDTNTDIGLALDIYLLNDDDPWILYSPGAFSLLNYLLANTLDAPASTRDTPIVTSSNGKWFLNLDAVALKRKSNPNDKRRFKNFKFKLQVSLINDQRLAPSSWPKVQDFETQQ